MSSLLHNTSTQCSVTVYYNNYSYTIFVTGNDIIGMKYINTYISRVIIMAMSVSSNDTVNCCKSYI